MDAFLEIHGESHIFVGSRPTNAKESLNRLELATGISSAANFARESRSRKFQKPNGKISRLLKPNLFFAQYTDKEHQKFAQYFTPAYLPDESFISSIVILIHHVAEGLAQNSRVQLGEVELGSRIVTSAGDVMRKYLEKNGDVACKELRVFCKNKRPIQGDIDYGHGKSDGLVHSWLSLEDILGPKGVASLMTGIPIA
ncbi:hypothetical protein N7540_013060 [Penicillium herquei]|nr:hypothetical protein N7540_013060 [Penicillium herquei]